MTSTFKACMKKFALDMYYKASFLVFAGLSAPAWCDILVENILAKNDCEISDRKTVLRIIKKLAG